ncbi:hypothetical protein ACHAXS_012014 [Conticribra weissflogii]
MPPSTKSRPSGGNASSKSKSKSKSKPTNNNNNNNNNGNPKKTSKPKRPLPQQQQQQQPRTTQTTQTTQKQPTNTNPPKKATDPPLECTSSEFHALLGDARGLSSPREAAEELLDCARHGEVDAVRAILDVWGDGNHEDDDDDGSRRTVDATDASGSTSLHKASANGHASTVRLLLSRGARHLPNESGNTPLHWAAGAGHAEVVKLLLDHFDALFREREEMKGRRRNNGCDDNHNDNDDDDDENDKVEQLDVLLKNKFGRSALTEGFASGDTPTVDVLLNHDSAEEERLIGGLERKDVADEEGEEIAAGRGEGDENADRKGGAGDETKKEKEKEKEKEKTTKSILHEFNFLLGGQSDPFISASDCEGHPSVFIRELPIAHADDPFGQSPIEDTTGLGIWCASLVMARWLASPEMTKRMEGKNVVELGAGCGVPGLAAAVYGKPKSVTITDLNPETIDNIQYNIGLNASNTPAKLVGSSIDWGDETTYPSDEIDFVIGSDLIYQKDIVPLLKKVVTGLLSTGLDNDDDDVSNNNNKTRFGGSFLYVAPEGGRDGLPEFINAMKTEGFECVSEEIAPGEYSENPLKNGDEEDCFLNFHELMGTVYVLYEFRRR